MRGGTLNQDIMLMRVRSGFWMCQNDRAGRTAATMAWDKARA